MARARERAPGGQGEATDGGDAPLGRYQSMRDFERTPEPSGGERDGDGDGPGRPRFVVQEHDASSMHWDLRLEHDGVAASWAVPKGVPLDPDQTRLAIHTEDHPLEYLEFEGEIPEGSYGAGRMRIFDAGTFEAEEFSDDKVVFDLHGERVHGRYVLARSRRGRGGSGDDDGDADGQREKWILRRLDPPLDPDHVPVPEHVKPMLATSGELPDDDERWAFEVKWDGIRVIAFAEGGRIRLETRNCNDVTRQYPELARLGRELGAREAVLDGEIVAFDEQGRPSFQRLQRRLGLSSETTIRNRARSTPVLLAIFDVLQLDGRDLRGCPWTERRAALEQLELSGEHWMVPAAHRGGGAELLHAVVEQGLEGVMAKRLDSPYREGSRSRAWLKVKVQRRQEFVVAGYTCGAGSRSGSIGALLLGVHDVEPWEAEQRGDPQRLVYAGSVGTGFTRETLDMLAGRLEELATDESPFDEGGPGATKPIGKWQAMRAGKAGARPQQVRWARPELVAEVEFTEFTRDGTVRHPSFKGLRDDKPPAEVVREDERDARLRSLERLQEGDG